MIEIANAINSLPSHAMQADFVPPSEQLITLTYGQLQELITQAVEKAIQPLQDEITALRTERDQDRAEFERFKATHRAFAVQTTKDLDALFEANLKPTPAPQQPSKKTASPHRRTAPAHGRGSDPTVSIAKAARLLGSARNECDNSSRSSCRMDALSWDGAQSKARRLWLSGFANSQITAKFGIGS
jgi:hypothetical protein